VGWQRFFTISGMVGLVTAVLAGSTVGLLTAIVSDHVLVAAITAGVLVATAVFAALIHFQHSSWQQAGARVLTDERAETNGPGADSGPAR
jgi:ABC-type uncharacterized transport system permease subunit